MKLVNQGSDIMLKLKNKSKTTQGLKRSLITSTNPKSPISEQYRTIRTNIEFSMVDRKLKTLVCTSASPGEGKSTTIANLAVTFAQQGKRVLFIDTDLRKPTVHYTFRVENRHGLTSVLTRRTTLDKAIIPSSRDNNLYILPSGPIPPNPSELLGSNVMREMVAELSLHYDMILFDAPPVLAVTDAQILGNLCDGIILVIKSNQTEKDSIVKAKELLDQVNAHIVGTVLNGKRQAESGYYYYYYGKS